VFDRVVPPAEHATFEGWRDATQAYQAALVQLQVEDLRRLKYAPTGGFCHFCFADGHPAVTWSVLDHERVAKRGYAALRDACRPVLPMIEPRQGLVHVVSERGGDLAGALVEVHGGGRRLGCFTGDVAADAVSYVGRVDLDGVDEASAVVEHPSIGRIENRYGAVLLASVREEPQR
jgi:beta-mannosidase